MDEPLKKRRFWQLHLSTAVVLMFATGALFYSGRVFIEDIALTFRAEYPERFRYSDRLSDCFFFAQVIVVDAILAAVCEWLIRRREGRKTEKELYAIAGAVFDRACGWGRTPYCPQVRAHLNAQGFDCSKKLKEMADKMGYGQDNLIVQETVKTRFLLFAISKTNEEPEFVARMKWYLELNTEGEQNGKEK